MIAASLRLAIARETRMAAFVKTPNVEGPGIDVPCELHCQSR